MTTEHDHTLRAYIRALIIRSRRLLDIIPRGRRKIMRLRVKAALPTLREPPASPVPTLQPERDAPRQGRIETVSPLQDGPGGAYGPGQRFGTGPRGSASPTARQIARMQEALDSLPEMTRAIFIAHSHDELTFETIAQRFGIPLCDVTREISHALIALDSIDRETGA